MVIIEKFKKLDTLEKMICILSIVLIVMIISFIIFILYFKNLEVRNNHKSEDNPTQIYDPNIIPTYPEFSQIMDNVVKDIYGKSYDELLEQDNKDYITIPNTNININKNSFGDQVDLAVLSALALYRNPYTNAPVDGDSNPLVIEEVEPIKTLPNGVTLDLSSVVENYSDISIYTGRDNILRWKVNGKVNGNYFNESIDMKDIYQYYFYE